MWFVDESEPSSRSSMLTASGWDSLAASNAHIELYRACRQARFDNPLEVLAEIGVVGIERSAAVASQDRHGRQLPRRSAGPPHATPAALSAAPSTRHRLFRSQSRIVERRSLVLVAVSIS